MEKDLSKMTLGEANRAFLRVTRNMSYEDVAAIDADPSSKEDDSPLVLHAKSILRRIIELKCGVKYPEKEGDMLHHPV